MTRLGLRLAFGRGARVRLTLTALAIALGVLVVTCGSMLMVASSRATDRSRLWNDLFAPLVRPGAWSVHRVDLGRGRHATVIDVTAKTPEARRVLGISRAPRSGETLVSPEIARWMRRGGVSVPGHVVGVLGQRALGRPHDLVVVAGVEGPASGSTGSFSLFSPSDIRVSGWALVAAVPFAAIAAFLVCLPVFAFVAAAARVGSRRREERFVAMRLVGATPGQVRRIAVVETVAAALLGVAAGLAATELVRVVLVHRRSYFGSDLRFWPPILVWDLVLVPMVAALSALVALRPVAFSPGAIARRGKLRCPARHGWWGGPIAGVAAGLVALIVTPRSAVTWLLGIVTLAIVGSIVSIGPRLLRVLARLVDRRAARPATLIAVRRVLADPRARYRGLMVTAFVLFAVTATTMSGRSTSALPKGSRSVLFVGNAADMDSTAAVPRATIARLRAVRGVRELVPVAVSGMVSTRDGVIASGGMVVADCATYARTVGERVSSCRAGLLLGTSTYLATVDGATGGAPPPPPPLASVTAHVGEPATLSLADAQGRPIRRAVTIGGYLPGMRETHLGVTSGPVPPAAAALVGPGVLTSSDLSAVMLGGAILRTDGRPETTTRVGRIALAAGVTVETTTTRQGGESTPARRAAFFAWAIAFVLAMAACSLAVSTVDGIFARRHALATLRAAGTPLSVLRRASMIEVALPLATALVVGVGGGIALALAISLADGHPVAWRIGALVGLPAAIAVVWVAVTAVSLTALGRASSWRDLRTDYV